MPVRLAVVRCDGAAVVILMGLAMLESNRQPHPYTHWSKELNCDALFGYANSSREILIANILLFHSF
jgi:hypothetical protein